MAHAIHGYPGSCKNIHGHSYELHVTVASSYHQDEYIPAPGFVIDFKEIKKLVKAAVVDIFDHKVILSNHFILDKPSFSKQENLLIWHVEPTAENMLIFIKQTLNNIFPEEVKLVRLKLYETKDSYAEWTNGI
jgi:6-pyruvoyltetrahydropterin/6-carboxytetrahydropterin synthase